MKQVLKIEVQEKTKEERLPDFASDFPYIASCSELKKSLNHFVPWHWHKAVEVFYLDSGEMEYETPKGTQIFQTGSGGMVNSSILHKITLRSGHVKNFLHIFDASLIMGEQGSRIAQKYVLPMLTAPQIELIALHPDQPEHKEILELLRTSFLLSEQEAGYEFKLRAVLSEIWMRLFELSYQVLQKKAAYDTVNDKIKAMMLYVQEHYADKITISELAAAAFLSERDVFRIFKLYLHMTPVEYMNGYRLQMACQMLASGQESVTQISNACGLGSSSYFGKLFRHDMGCTPLDYRKKWRDNTIK